MPVLVPVPLTEDGITFMLVCVECLSYFKSLADHRPELSTTRLDVSSMEMSLETRPRDKLNWHGSVKK